ncbi:transferrin-binding protein-like solute binding protein [Haemophilus parainfluenzae]|uniref:transferrin-binding protein-like solute binding protein n=1 Tax=Haemophilus parainfluenzae TaxID=729 RepID=UPI000FFEF871|nr:transferrin-binding protein-like solute binding protein [Haemophilus parainfluenzae]KAB1992602.1 ABC transporter substrate-binding protein [Haemophilus parainfluenzae]QAT94771.1 ABC transporter substrate-binding protein [Haemophilus parainfluenzae]
MKKIKLSIIALSCVMALSACSSSSKGGSDNSEQIRQAETELNQRITEANKKAEAATKKAEDSLKKAEDSLKKAEESVKKADESIKKAEIAIKVAQSNGNQTEEEKKATEAAIKAAEAERKAAEEAKKSAEEAKKAAEERLKQLENLKADEKARIPLSDKIFGGINGEMKDAISGGVLASEGSDVNRPLTRDIRDLTIIDESGKLADIDILRRAGDIDPWTYEEYNDLYNLRKEGQTILSNSSFQASAFGTYFDNLSGNQYFFAQGLPTAIAQIPITGLVEYKGGVAYQKDGSNSELSEMKATADFANKVIDINITEKANAVPGMNFGGKITANSFAGEVNGIKTQGGFFGKDAQEMTGLFTNEADKSRGAFGGIKQ